MLDVAEAVVTIIILLAWIVGIGSAIRQRRIARRVLRSLTEEQRQALREVLDQPKSGE